jgi:CheY-like chemotaxis protein
MEDREQPAITILDLHQQKGPIVIRIRHIIGIALATALSATAIAQESRQFYKKPETTAEFWRAMNHEIEVGQFKVAAGYLKGFLTRNPTDEELLQIQDNEGSSAFGRLLTIPDLRADAKPLVERVDAAVQKYLGDPKRLAGLIKNLSATREERSYAIEQLRRAGAAAMPALIDALLNATDNGQRVAILSALPKLDQAIVPPLLAALDIEDPSVRVELIDVLSERAEKAATPFLWYLATSPKQPPTVRDRAIRVLATFLGINGSRLPTAEVSVKLPAAKAELTKEAERYYQHQIKFPDTGAVAVWRWDAGKKQLVSEALPIGQAEEYHGLRFAGQALDLDPSNVPAQIIYLSFLLDKGSDRPGIKEVVRSANPELLIAVLKKALAERRLPVILAATAALGDLAEVRAVRASGSELPVLVQALNYPDRRVQMAAADAVLRIPAAPTAPVAARVVEILGRSLPTEAEAKGQATVLVAFANDAVAQAIAKSVRRVGYRAVIAHSGREVLRRLNEAADIDVLLVDSALPEPGLAPLLADLRADRNAGRLPLLLTTPGGREASLRPLAERYQEEVQRLDERRNLTERFRSEGANNLVERSQDEVARREESLARLSKRFGDESAAIEDNLRRMTERQPNISVISVSQVWDDKRLSDALHARLADAASKPVAGAESKDNAAKAFEWLVRLARGEVSGYDLRPATGPILAALRSKELANLAVEAAGRLPGSAPQRGLAGVVLDPGQPESLRSAAAIELSRHIQQHGLLLPEEQVRSISALYGTLAEPKLKANVALILGSLHPDARQTGERLRNFTPVFGAPPAKEKTEAQPERSDG